MAVRDRRQDLREDERARRLFEQALAHDVLEQVPALAQIEDQIQICIIAEGPPAGSQCAGAAGR
jgi:hypothetical protein